MDKKTKPKQGEILLLLANRSGKPKNELASAFEIHPGHLSKIFKSEFLTSKIKQKAALIFDVSESIFDGMEDVSLPDTVMEPTPKYDPLVVDGSKPSDLLNYLERKEARYFEERARLIALIERKDREFSAERGRLLDIIEALTKK